MSLQRIVERSKALYLYFFSYQFRKIELQYKKKEKLQQETQNNKRLAYFAGRQASVSAPG